MVGVLFVGCLLLFGLVVVDFVLFCSRVVVAWGFN